MKTSPFNLLSLSVLITLQVACKKDNPVVIPPPSDGETFTLNGGEGGASAANSVFVDFSTDQQDSAKRDSWDLGFYSGTDFRVILNNTNGASGIVVNKTDINAVSAADITLDDLAIAMGEPGAYSNIDNVLTAELSGTVIAAISASDANNRVYVINPAGGSHSSVLSVDKLIKVRVLQKSGGYTLQYAKLNETTYSTIDIPKDAAYNFTFFSFTTCKVVKVQPEKSAWDITWTWSMYYTGAAGNTSPYSFSDLVFINTLAGVQAAEKIYAGSDIRNDAYNLYNADSLATVSFQSKYDLIGSKWRGTTTTPPGVLTDRFYLVKDPAGNVYKLKFISFHAQDGGVRGKPVIEYKLVKRG